MIVSLWYTGSSPSRNWFKRKTQISGDHSLFILLFASSAAAVVWGTAPLQKKNIFFPTWVNAMISNPQLSWYLENGLCKKSLLFPRPSPYPCLLPRASDQTGRPRECQTGVTSLFCTTKTCKWFLGWLGRTGHKGIDSITKYIFKPQTLGLFVQQILIYGLLRVRHMNIPLGTARRNIWDKTHPENLECMIGI